MPLGEDRLKAGELGKASQIQPRGLRRCRRNSCLNVEIATGVDRPRVQVLSEHGDGPTFQIRQGLAIIYLTD